MNITNHQEKPYFDRLPRYALPALQAAFDKAQGKQFGTVAIHQGFCRDMDEIGCEKPSKPAMTQWIAQVQEGSITRPGGQSEERLEAELKEKPWLPEGKGTVERDFGREQAPLPADTKGIFPTPYKTQTKEVGERYSDKAAELYQGKPVFDKEQILNLKQQAHANMVFGVDLASGADQNASIKVEIKDGKPFFTPEFPADLPTLADIEKIKETLRKLARQTADDAVDEVADELASSARQIAHKLVIGALRDLVNDMERGAA